MIGSYICELFQSSGTASSFFVLLVLSEKIWYCLSECPIKLWKYGPWNFCYVIDFKLVLMCIWICWNGADIKGIIVNGDLFLSGKYRISCISQVISELW